MAIVPEIQLARPNSTRVWRLEDPAQAALGLAQSVIGYANLIWPRFGLFRSFDLAPPGALIPALGGLCV
jgi:hypothetical protein